MQKLRGEDLRSGYGSKCFPQLWESCTGWNFGLSQSFLLVIFQIGSQTFAMGLSLDCLLTWNRR
jgi:hypothetical protein